MKMLFLVLALAVIVGPASAQGGPIPGLDKPTDRVMTRIKSIHGRLEGSSLRESGAAVKYENGAYGVQYQLGDNPDKDQPGYSDYWQQKTYEDNIVASRVGDPIKLCLVSIPLHCPKGDGRGRGVHGSRLAQSPMVESRRQRTHVRGRLKAEDRRVRLSDFYVAADLRAVAP